MTGRSVPEWIGRDADTPVPARVRVRVFERYGGVCQLTGRKILVGDQWDLDHREPLSLGTWGFGRNRNRNFKGAASRRAAIVQQCQRPVAKSVLNLH